jgi:hypothetical protein
MNQKGPILSVAVVSEADIISEHVLHGQNLKDKEKMPLQGQRHQEMPPK